MMIWATVFAFNNRVSYTGALQGAQHEQIERSLNIASFISSEMDFENVHRQMEQVVTRILCRYIPHFQESYRSSISWHMEHNHSEESKKKSEIVCF